MNKTALIPDITSAKWQVILQYLILVTIWHFISFEVAVLVALGAILGTQTMRGIE